MMIRLVILQLRASQISGIIDALHLLYPCSWNLTLSSQSELAADSGLVTHSRSIEHVPLSTLHPCRWPEAWWITTKSALEDVMNDNGSSDPPLLAIVSCREIDLGTCNKDTYVERDPRYQPVVMVHGNESKRRYQDSLHVPLHSRKND
jgi:hypothetical protein